MVMETKTCSTCKEEKPLSAFGPKRWTRKDGTVVTGLRSRCKPCKVACERPKSEEERQRRNERQAANLRRRLDAMTPEERQKRRAKQYAWGRTWRHNNPDKVAELKRRHRARHKDAIAEKKARDAKTDHGRALDRARSARYHAAHKDTINARAKKRRDTLEDWYVKSLITRGKIPAALIPDGMVQARKLVTQIKRELKEKRA